MEASTPDLAAVEEEAEGPEEDEEEEEGLGAEDGEVGAAEEEEATGPSVFVAGNFVPPQEDMKLLDARQLVVQGKVQEDSEADKAAASVSAFARVHNTKVWGTGRRVGGPLVVPCHGGGVSDASAGRMSPLS